MNNLSWFIYLTQVVDNLGGAATAFLVIGGILGAIGSAVVPLIIMDEFPDFQVRKWVVLYCCLMGFCTFVAIFTPSRQTMIMIAGSEIGERVAKYDGVQSVVNPGMDLIRKWIKQEADKIKDKS